MQPRLNHVSLIAATLLLCLSPAFPGVTQIAATVAQAPTKTAADRLYLEGNQLYGRGEYREALQNYRQVLEMRRNQGDRPRIGNTLHKLGAVYYKLGEYDRALESFSQALAIRQEIGDRRGTGSTLNSMGGVYQQQGNYDRALLLYRQALTLRKLVGDKPGAARTLNNLGLIYENQGRYPTARELYEQALTIFQDLGNPKGEGVLLNHIGVVHHRLGEYSEAQDSYQQALDLIRKRGDRANEGKILHNMGFAYTALEQHDKALDFYQQALEIFQELGDRPATGNTLNNIGFTYDRLGQQDKALEVLNEALGIFQEIGDRAGTGNTLDSLGTVYKSMGEYDKALELYHQALVILKEVGDRPGEVVALGNMGEILEKQNQLELAIAFYKQAVNITEAIRKDLQVLSLQQQQSYTGTVADTYRHLAGLLLQQDRVTEAHHILDLLKVQELHQYFQKMEGNAQTAQGVHLHGSEQEVLDNHGSIQAEAVALGKELASLQQIPVSRRTRAQQQRIVELQQAQGAIAKQFNQFIKSREVVSLAAQLNERTGGESLNLTGLDRLHTYLDGLEENAVILHPLILPDRLELILVTRYGPPIRRTVAVNQQDFQRAIGKFRRNLMTRRKPVPFVQSPAKQFYDWLIKPIERDLQEAEAQTIIYAADGQLRYIPLAALYDGNKWLIERFGINNITAVSLTNFDSQHADEPQVLAAAFAEGNHSFQVRDRAFEFSGLPFAGLEVETLANTIENTTKLVDEEFSPEATVPHLNKFHIIHFATHAAFVKGHPEESFILFGNGDRVSLHDIENWSLPDVDLVVFSACETAVGGIQGNGHEILGFGYQIQRTGAKAAIASLWKVDDLGTHVLMDTFYQQLNDNLSKTEALRQAQIALITGQTPGIEQNLEHPYYWAPFILIGHGL
ncbi:MAG: tetratricopeptide repeat protein [Hormoscilla sp.]